MSVNCRVMRLFLDFDYSEKFIDFTMFVFILYNCSGNNLSGSKNSPIFKLDTVK